MNQLNGYWDASVITGGIQGAVDAAIANSPKGGVIYLPAGQYVITSTITVNTTGLEFRGDGPGSTMIVFNTASVFAPTFFDVQTADSVTFRDIAFVGNGYATGYPDTWQVASPVITITGGWGHKIRNCYFTDNTGFTISLTGVTDVEISGCRFYQVGFNDGHNKGSGFHVDAIVTDHTSVGVRIRDCHLDTCGYGGIKQVGSQSDTSHNYLTNVVSSALYYNYFDTRVGFNTLNTLTVVAPGDSGAGIYGDKPSQFTVIGNLVSNAIADGFPVNGWADGAEIGNIAWDTASSMGDCGFQILPQPSPQTNEGLAFVGNIASCDITGTGAQPYGVHMEAPGGQANAFDSIVLGTATHGNAKQGLRMDSNTLQDYSGVNDPIIGNSDWMERLHSAGPKSTANGSTLANVTLALNYFGSRGAVRITAAGTSTSTGTHTFTLTFGGTSPSTILNYSPSTSATTWQLLVTLTKQDAPTSTDEFGAAVVFVWGTTVKQFFVTFDQDVDSDGSSPPPPPVLKLSVTGTSTVTCQFFTVDRC